MLAKNEPPHYLRIREAAAILNVTPRTVHDIIKRKIGLPIRRIGTKTIRIPRDKLLAWIEKQER